MQIAFKYYDNPETPAEDKKVLLNIIRRNAEIIETAGNSGQSLELAGERLRTRWTNLQEHHVGSLVMPKLGSLDTLNAIKKKYGL